MSSRSPATASRESLLRGLLLDLLDATLSAGGDAASSDAVARELMRLLSDGYSLENYYNRQSPPTRHQQGKFRTIVRYLWRYADRRDVLDVIADAEHFSKSYVSHLVKDIGSVSFERSAGVLPRGTRRDAAPDDGLHHAGTLLRPLQFPTRSTSTAVS